MIIESIKYNGKDLAGAKITVRDLSVSLADLDGNILDPLCFGVFQVNGVDYQSQSFINMLLSDKDEIFNMCIVSLSFGKIFFIMIPRPIDIKFRKIISVEECDYKGHILSNRGVYGISDYFAIIDRGGTFSVVPLVKYIPMICSNFASGIVDEIYLAVIDGSLSYKVKVKLLDYKSYMILTAKGCMI